MARSGLSLTEAQWKEIAPLLPQPPLVFQECDLPYGCSHRPYRSAWILRLHAVQASASSTQSVCETSCSGRSQLASSTALPVTGET